MAGLRGDAGFSLLELVVAVSIYGAGMAVAIVGFVHVVAVSHLSMTRNGLLWNLRWMQAKAYETDTFSYLNLQKFVPSYQTYDGWTLVNTYNFEPGVTYKEGYLQMPSGQIFYGVPGDSHQGGTVSLVDDRGDEEDLVLYLNSGLVVAGETAHDTP